MSRLLAIVLGVCGSGCSKSPGRDHTTPDPQPSLEITTTAQQSRTTSAADEGIKKRDTPNDGTSPASRLPELVTVGFDGMLSEAQETGESSPQLDVQRSLVVTIAGGSSEDCPSEVRMDYQNPCELVPNRFGLECQRLPETESGVGLSAYCTCRFGKEDAGSDVSVMLGNKVYSRPEEPQLQYRYTALTSGKFAGPTRQQQCSYLGISFEWRK